MVTNTIDGSFLHGSFQCLSLLSHAPFKYSTLRLSFPLLPLQLLTISHQASPLFILLQRTINLDKMPTDNKGEFYTYKNSGTNSQVRLSFLSLLVEDALQR